VIKNLPANLTLLLFFTSIQTLALVDYTESDSFVPSRSGAVSVKPVQMNKQNIKRPARQEKTGGRSSTRLSGEISYASQSVSLNDTEGKVSTLKLKTHFETDYNIFLDASYYQASSSSSSLIGENGSSSQKGNPEVVLGFNWLKIGKSADAVTVDILAGFSFGQKNSSFATGRNDKIVGVMTAKRFHHFVLGLGYELRMVGDTQGESELSIGNITTLEANLGWVVSHDIRFLLAAKRYSISAGDSTNARYLDQNVSFGTISPKLLLSLSPYIHMSLGANFRSRRIKDSNYLGARLWNLDAPYGNSLDVGLSFML
jgi:hypothetical protein